MEHPELMTPADTQWHAVETRDASADGTFVYAVQTTGIYCRPACPSRLARRENVQFFDTPAAAAGMGFRACKRCKPDDVSAFADRQRALENARQQIDQSDGPVSLD